VRNDRTFSNSLRHGAFDMFTKKSVSRVFSILFILAFLLALAGPAHTVSASRTEATQAAQVQNSPRTLPAGHVTAISAGNFHTCELRSDKTIQCWGDDDPTYAKTTVPTPNADWVQVSAGANHTCARKSDEEGNDTIQCWGRSTEGRTTVIPAGVNDWEQVSAGGRILAHTGAMPCSTAGAIITMDRQLCRLGLEIGCKSAQARGTPARSRMLVSQSIAGETPAI
jgi:hypothetical protein